ncbi:hypothetical protein DFH06DRAFT_1421568 [Mycena polygramma]|nr:hypothetical protein DFH06DRAFT_1421568 [Mycena polygramma]
MSAVFVTQSQSQTRSERGKAKRGNNRGREATRGGAHARPARPAVEEVEGTQEVAAPTVLTTDESTEDVAICWICAEPVKHYAVSGCNHRTCHVCSLRLRAFYKKTDCTFCIFASFDTATMPYKGAKLSLYFETWRKPSYSCAPIGNCPHTECDYLGNSWSDLKLYVRATHGRLMCDLCIRHNFAHEHTFYPPNILPCTSPPCSGTSGPIKPLQQRARTSRAARILCASSAGSRECFFGDDELFSHMRETHEECFVCKRDDVRDQYFLNYAALEAHFTAAHHLCTHATCRLSYLARRSISKRTSSRSTRGRPGGGGGRRREGFGAALTVERESPPPAAQSPAASPPPPRADVDPAVAALHASFLARLASLAPNPSTALPAARAAIRSFRASAI